LTVLVEDTRWILQLEGDCGMASAAELKERLMDGLQAAREIELDLRAAREIDVAVLQLLWAAVRAAASQQLPVVCRWSEYASAIARQAGFDGFSAPAPE